MNVDQFLRRIVFMAQHFGDYDIEDIVKICLMDIEMSSDLDGYKYLVYGIAYMYKHSDVLMTKHVYPAIAEKFGCYSTHVEVSIRRAINAAWRYRNEKWGSYFSEERRPTNREFISRMVDVITFWDICRNNLIAEGAGERE